MTISITTHPPIYHRVERIKDTSRVVMLASVLLACFALISSQLSMRADGLIQAAKVAFIAGAIVWIISRMLLKQETVRKVYDGIGLAVAFVIIIGFFMVYPLAYALGLARWI